MVLEDSFGDLVFQMILSEPSLRADGVESLCLSKFSRKSPTLLIHLMFGRHIVHLE